MHVGPRYCFVEGNIVFTKECCINGYVPRKNDVVSGSMMECDQGQRSKLRARTVCLNSEAVNRQTPDAHIAKEHSRGDDSLTDVHVTAEDGQR